jgi:hypothetical protein
LRYSNIAVLKTQGTQTLKQSKKEYERKTLLSSELSLKFELSGPFELAEVEARGTEDGQPWTSLVPSLALVTSLKTWLVHMRDSSKTFMR